MTEPTVQVTEYTVSLLPETFLEWDIWAVRVQYRGQGRWSVSRYVRRCLSVDGEWNIDLPFEDGDGEWLARHRFDHDTALAKAKEAVHTVVVNGRTAADVLAELEREG